MELHAPPTANTRKIVTVIFAGLLSKLLSEHLVEEIPAQGALPVWRRDGNKTALALRITERGLAAIGADQDGSATKADEALSEQLTKRDRRQPWPSPRRAGSNRKQITKARRKPPKPAVPNRNR